MDIKREPRSKRKRYILIGSAVLVLGVVTVALARLEPAPPTVDAATIWTDTVVRGTMVREVRGPGTLVPEQIQLISAVTAGRIEEIPVQPGAEVEPNTVLLELSNPDVLVGALRAEQALTDAEAQLVDLGSNLTEARLSQRALVAQVRANYLDAERTAENNVPLAERGLISQAELVSSQERAEALATQLEVEQERLQVIEAAAQERIAAQEQQIERLRSIAQFERNRVESMTVRAGVSGVLVELPLEDGQWVTPGQLLARLVRPGPLKAELRIPENMAAEVIIGQTAYVDLRNDTIEGTVMRIDPAAEGGTVRVDVALPEDLPSGARPQLNVQGTVEVARLADVLHVGRPSYGQADGTVGLFRLVDGGDEAVRTTVRLGASSVNTVEIVDGLQEGDIVILSEMSEWDSYDRVRIR